MIAWIIRPPDGWVIVLVIIGLGLIWWDVKRAPPGRPRWRVRRRWRNWFGFKKGVADWVAFVQYAGLQHNYFGEDNKDELLVIVGALVNKSADRAPIIRMQLTVYLKQNKAGIPFLRLDQVDEVAMARLGYRQGSLVSVPVTGPPGKEVFGGYGFHVGKNINEILGGTLFQHVRNGPSKKDQKIYPMLVLDVYDEVTNTGYTFDLYQNCGAIR